jgi:TPR repeat protein
MECEGIYGKDEPCLSASTRNRTDRCSVMTVTFLRLFELTSVRLFLAVFHMRFLGVAVIILTSMAACASIGTSKDADATTSEQKLAQGYAAYKAGRYEHAYEILRPLAEAGNSDAQAQLGTIYLHGNYKPRDLDEALKWFRLAASKGSASAQTQIGAMYEYGIGFSQDYVEAARWYKLAAAQEFANAQHLLGLLYQRGDGVEQNYSEAARLFRQVAGKGFGYGQVSLARLQSQGIGVPLDLVQADMWLTLASKVGHPADRQVQAAAQSEKALIESQMTSDEINMAEQLARDWHPTIPCRGIECFILK